MGVSRPYRRWWVVDSVHESKVMGKLQLLALSECLIGSGGVWLRWMVDKVLWEEQAKN